MNLGGTEKSREGPGVGGVLSGVRTSVFFILSLTVLSLRGLGDLLGEVFGPRERLG